MKNTVVCTLIHVLNNWYDVTRDSIVGHKFPQDISVQAIKGFLMVDEIYPEWPLPFKQLLHDCAHSMVVIWSAVDLDGLKPAGSLTIFYPRLPSYDPGLYHSRPFQRLTVALFPCSSCINWGHLSYIASLTRIPTLHSDGMYSCSQIFIRRPCSMFTHIPRQRCYQVLLICCSLGIWLLCQLQPWLEVHNCSVKPQK